MVYHSLLVQGFVHTGRACSCAAAKKEDTCIRLVPCHGFILLIQGEGLPGGRVMSCTCVGHAHAEMAEETTGTTPALRGVSALLSTLLELPLPWPWLVLT